MRDRPSIVSRLLDRAARLAFTFVVLNYSAVAGLLSALVRRKVWR